MSIRAQAPYWPEWEWNTPTSYFIPRKGHPIMKTILSMSPEPRREGAGAFRGKPREEPINKIHQTRCILGSTFCVHLSWTREWLCQGLFPKDSGKIKQLSIPSPFCEVFLQPCVHYFGAIQDDFIIGNRCLMMHNQWHTIPCFYYMGDNYQRPPDLSESPTRSWFPVSVCPRIGSFGEDQTFLAIEKVKMSTAKSSAP